MFFRKMLYFYTVTSKEQIHLCDTLQKSLQRFGHDVNILPLYEKTNFSKLNISSVFESKSYKDDDLIIITDGFDVVCVKDPGIYVTKYFQDNPSTDILFSSENMFGNNMVCIKEYYDKYNEVHGTTGKYLNAGVIIGKANKIKQFYSQLMRCVPELRNYLPPDRRETTGDQTYIINYLYHIDFMNYKDINIKIDLKDEVTFTNTIVERPYNIFDYVFIHTWGIYIADPHYKYIKDQQYKKWCEIKSSLGIM